MGDARAIRKYTNDALWSVGMMMASSKSDLDSVRGCLNDVFYTTEDEIESLVTNYPLP
jgi:hypothetical protein